MAHLGVIEKPQAKNSLLLIQNQHSCHAVLAHKKSILALAIFSSII